MTEEDILDPENYNQNRGIYSPVIVHNGVVCGFWLTGNDYRNPSKYYGAYPPNYLKRMKLLFPNAHDVLHLFSGKVVKGTWEKETTADINPELRPDIICNAETLEIFPFDLILADPPYENNHEKYGTERVNKHKAIKQAARNIKTGGYLVWLDTIQPMWAKADGWQLKGTIGLCQSTMHRVRMVTILRKI